MLLCAPPLIHKATVPLALTHKGYGSRQVDPAAVGGTTMSYGTVLGGSAPAAGDLIVWNWLVGLADDGTNLELVRDLTGSGWTQSIVPPGDGQFHVSVIVAKVLSAGDLSSPIVLQQFDTSVAGISQNFGAWSTYSVAGSISSLAIPVHTRNQSGSSAPSNVSVNSSALDAPAAAITCTEAQGDDGSISLSGITLDQEASVTNMTGYYTGGLDVRLGFKADIGGASYTLSKGDDGLANQLAGGYLAVS